MMSRLYHLIYAAPDSLIFTTCQADQSTWQKHAVKNQMQIKFAILIPEINIKPAFTHFLNLLLYENLF